jgi:methyl coenzyme M reductase subunit C
MVLWSLLSGSSLAQRGILAKAKLNEFCVVYMGGLNKTI